jgi:hypothetical protein
MRYEVIITNKVFGDSSAIRTLEQLSNYNVFAFELAKLCLKDGKEHSSGMWTVRPVKDQCEHCLHLVDECVCCDDDICNEMGAR